MERSVFCCICLKSAFAFAKVSDCDSKRTRWLHKLAACVPEVKWNENWMVCVACGAKLDVVYEFRMQCINSEAERKDKTSETHNRVACYVSVKSEAVDVCETEINTTVTQNPIDKCDSERLTFVMKTESNLPSQEDYSIVPDQKLTEEKHKSNPELQMPFSCGKCEATFNSSSKLMQHMKYHTGGRTHICSYCGKGFMTKSNLNVHEKHHLNKREMECDLCGKRFNTYRDIHSHKLVVHTDPKDWTHACGYCDKRFPIKSNLDLHTRRHTGDRPFACHLCEKKFIQKVVLQKHISSHSNMRAFKCSECHKEYKEKRMMEIHLKKVHDIGDARVPVCVKKYFCSLCPKAYFEKNKLTRHMCSHTGVKPYCCEICHKKFTDVSYVKQHLKTVHKLSD